MNGRPSMLTKMLRANWLMSAWCPRCGNENVGAVRPITMSEDGAAHCTACGESWTPEMERQTAEGGR